jgi:hypothetical protein
MVVRSSAVVVESSNSSLRPFAIRQHAAIETHTLQMSFDGIGQALYRKWALRRPWKILLTEAGKFLMLQRIKLLPRTLSRFGGSLDPPVAPA